MFSNSYNGQRKSALPKMFLWEKIRIRGWIGFVVIMVQKIRDLKFSKTACCETGKPSVTSSAKRPDYRRFPTARDRSRAATAFRPVDSFRWLGTLKIGKRI